MSKDVRFNIHLKVDGKDVVVLARSNAKALRESRFVRRQIPATHDAATLGITTSPSSPTSRQLQRLSDKFQQQFAVGFRYGVWAIWTYGARL